MTTALCIRRQRPFVNASPHNPRGSVRATATASDCRKVTPLIAGLAALLVGSTPAADAATLAQEAFERERLIDMQQQQLEYMLQQQENVKKAQIAAQRQALQSQVVSVETQLQQKITEEKANVVAAQKKGDTRLAEVAAAQEAELEQQAAKVRSTVVAIETRLDRAEMLAKAKAIAEKQQIQKTAQEYKADINSALDSWLESVAQMK